MRIAAVSDDGITISAHFGRATHYVVAEVEDGKILSQEQREKPGHHTFQQQPAEPQDHHAEHGHGDHEHSEGHGMGEGARSRHVQMIDVIRDCQVLLARGMGRGAYQQLEQAGIQPIITEVVEIREAIRAWSEGTLVDHTERLH